MVRRPELEAVLVRSSGWNQFHFDRRCFLHRRLPPSAKRRRPDLSCAFPASACPSWACPSWPAPVHLPRRRRSHRPSASSSLSRPSPVPVRLCRARKYSKVQAPRGRRRRPDPASARWRLYVLGSRGRQQSWLSRLFFQQRPPKKLKIKDKTQAKNSTFGRTFPPICQTREKNEIPESFSSKLKIFKGVALFIPLLITDFFKKTGKIEHIGVILKKK